MKYGFIGCGNMGSALVKALSENTKDIIICDADESKANAVAEKCGVKTGSITEVCQNCQRLFLAIKPQGLDNVVSSIYDITVTRKPVLISMLAGVKIETLENKFSSDLQIIRIMPNTPVGVGEGVVLYSPNQNADEALINDFLDDMDKAGTLVRLEEELIDAGCAVSGCGPAYMYMMADAVSNGAEKCGLTKEQAVKLASLTMIGAAKMILSSPKTPDELKIDVCSPGGSTIEGVKKLEEGGFYETVADAIIAAYNRNRELGNS